MRTTIAGPALQYPGPSFAPTVFESKSPYEAFSPRQRRRVPRLIEQIRRAIRALQYTPKTELAYVRWTKDFVRFHDMRHPRELGPDEIQQFVSYLANERRVSASTQNQALCALLFLYRDCSAAKRRQSVGG